MEFIPLDFLVAEIEKRHEYWREKEFESHSIESEIRMSECQHLMLLINTLEVKGVDLESEIERICKHHYINGDFEKAEIDGRTITNIAKHFFELGLKAQKNE